jgi:hypothetical protein
MKKLRLELEQLTVDSFDTVPLAAKRGTVVGEEQECTCPTACYTNCTCPGCPTCDHTCYQTCNATCDGETCDFSISATPFYCVCCPY